MAEFTIFIRRAVFLMLPVAMLLPAVVRAEPTLELSIDGINGITASTPFSVDAFSASVDGLEWHHDVHETESGNQEVIVARINGETLFEVVKGERASIDTIVVTSDRIDSWFGPRVGDTFESLSHNLQLGECQPGTETRSGTVICRAAETERVAYVFAGQWPGPDGQMPPLDVLDTWPLSSIEWQADGQASDQDVQNYVSPAFDCADTYGSIEEMICDDVELIVLDRRLNALYAQRIEIIDPDEALPIQAFQRGWIKARNECWKSTEPRRCVVDIYEERITELSEATSASLKGTTWRGRTLGDDTIPPGIEVELTFGTEGQLNGTSGCNRFVATYEVEGSKLFVSPVGGTRRLCPDAEMAVEHRFLKALERVHGWRILDGRLELISSTEELLTFSLL